MREINRTYHPDPGRLVDFIKLQVTDAMLSDDIFGGEAAEECTPVLFALALLATIPPVPNNRLLLDKTFTYMEQEFAQKSTGQFIYADVAEHYNRLLPIFQKSANLPRQTPMSNPYESVAKVAAFDLGFPEDGARIFSLTLWMTHYCKDAIAMFFAEDLARKQNKGGRKLQKLPAPEAAYEFVSMHVNNVVADPTFFTEGPPTTATEVMTGLFLFFVLALTTQSKALLMDTLEYTNKMLAANNFSPLFFDRIVNAIERYTAAYETNLQGKAKVMGYYTVDKVVDEALKMMGDYPNFTLKTNIISYLPVLLNDATAALFSA